MTACTTSKHTLLSRGGLAGLGLLLLAAGCTPRRTSQSDRDRGEVLFQEGSVAFLEGRYAAAEAAFARYYDDYRRTRKGVEAAYWLGLSRMERGKLRAAREAFRTVVDARPGRPLEARALTGTARATYLDGDAAAAETLYQRLRRSYGDVIDHGEILAALVECRRKRGDAEGAARYLETLRASYPESPYLQNADLPELASTTRYVVQAGAFSSKNKARRLAKRLKAAGFACFVTPRPADGQTLYAVQAGAFSTRAAADRRVSDLKARGFSAAIR